MRERLPRTPLRQRLARAFLRLFLPDRTADVLEELEELREIERREAGGLRAAVYYAQQVLAYSARLALAAVGDAFGAAQAHLRKMPGSVIHDVRDATRSLARAPAHAAITVVTLGLGPASASSASPSSSSSFLLDLFLVVARRQWRRHVVTQRDRG